MENERTLTGLLASERDLETAPEGIWYLPWPDGHMLRTVPEVYDLARDLMLKDVACVRLARVRQARLPEPKGVAVWTRDDGLQVIVGPVPIERMRP